MQAQLFHMSLNADDVVYTPTEVARYIVNYFKPSGMVLDPCRGDGSFFAHMPTGAEYCEIEDGRDFFAYHKKIDWIIGNPPYSIFQDWLKHSFEIADHVIYLVPTNKIFQSWKVMSAIICYGGIRDMLVFGSGHLVGFPFGFSVGAFHFEKNWRGETTIKFCKSIKGDL